MPTFALENIEAVVGKQNFMKLKVDDVVPFDEFEKSLQERDKKELASIYNIMNQVANNLSVPNTKFHPYSDGSDGFREYEFKTKSLRVYAIEMSGGKIVITGGTKARQSKDESEFRRLKKQYVESLKKD